jgi:WD40 repeat protein
MALSPGGKIIAVGSREGRIFLQGVDGGGKIELPQRHAGRVKCLAFSPDGTLLASGGDDRAITLWDVKSRSPRADDLKGQLGPVAALAFSADGQTLAAGINPGKQGGRQPMPTSGNISGGDQSEPGLIKLWYVSGDKAPAKSLREMGEPLKCHEEGVSSLAFNRAGNVLASGSSDGTVVLRDFDLNSAREKIARIVHRDLTESELREFTGAALEGGGGTTGAAW